MIQNQYQPTYISTNTDTVLAASGNISVHTVSFPKASAGAVTLKDKAGTTYLVFPASTVAGSYRLDAVFANGLTVTTASADVVIVTTQTP